jgi:hypothetical protein
LAATQIAKRRAVTDAIRADFPLCTSIVDDLRAVFGQGVKPKFFSEDGKTMGKPLEFAGTDVDKYLRMVDADAKRRGK